LSRHEVEDPGLYRALAAAVLEKSLRDLRSSHPKERRMARAWWLIPNNPLRSFWSDAAGMDEHAMIERLQERGILEPEEVD